MASSCTRWLLARAGGPPTAAARAVPRPGSLVAAMLVVGGLAGTMPPRPAGAETDGEPVCQNVSVPVHLSAMGQPATLRGTLCGGGGRGLQILLSGGTYGQAYWDFPHERDRYSYVHFMAARGWATLNLDRLGIGSSDHPPAEQVTIEAHVEATHQVVQAARAGRIAGRPFSRVYTVGNSMGAYIALLEAEAHDDVDGVISTGNLSSVRYGAPIVLASLYPAKAESRFAHLPAGYLTTRPQTRGTLFYASKKAEAGAIAVDEATKETFTDAELRGLLEGDKGRPERVRAPILSVVGEFDNIFCPTSCADPEGPAYAEAARYPNAASFETHVVSEAGHVLNLHTNAGDWFRLADDWLARMARTPVRAASP